MNNLNDIEDELYPIMERIMKKKPKCSSDSGSHKGEEIDYKVWEVVASFESDGEY